MTVTLVDTSVWVEYLRDRPTPAAQRFADAFDPVTTAICAPVRMELEIADDGASRRRASAIYLRLESLPIEDEDFESAASIYRDVRRRGHTVRSRMDLLIAAIAERHDAVLAHADVDFERIAAVRPNLSIESWL